MNKLILSLISFLAFSAAQAQVSSSMNYQTDNASKGFRLAILKPVLQAKTKLKLTENGDSMKFTGTEGMDNAFGFALGYANLPVSQVRYTGQASFINVENSVEGSKGKLDIIRLEGNVAWAFTNNLYMKGGLNFADVVSGTGSIEKLDPSFGLQAGLGVQFTKTVGLDISYSSMNFQKTESEDGVKSEVDINLSGLELGLTATF